MNQRFTYLGDTVVEVVIDGGSVTWSVLPPVPGDVPAVSAPLLPPDPAPVAAVEQQGAILAAPLTEAVQCAAAPPRIAPAASSGFKAGLASFGGMLAAGLLYVQENFGSVTDISLKNIILILVGALISGLLYFFYRWYKPHTP